MRDDVHARVRAARAAEREHGAVRQRARAEAGTKRVVLCSQQSMTTAHRIYGRLGFERAHEFDWSPMPGVDLWAFALVL